MQNKNPKNTNLKNSEKKNGLNGLIDFENITKKYNSHVNNLFHEKSTYKNKTPNLNEYNSISSLLPYRAYDPDTKFFVNKHTVGFMLETTPIVGASTETVNLLTGMITDGVPTGCLVQFTNYASPRIGNILDSWAESRKRKGGIFDKIAQRRVEFLGNGASKSLTHSSDYTLKNFRLFISVSLPANAGKKSLLQLVSFRKSLISTLTSIGMVTHEMNAEELINLLNEFLNPTTNDIYPPKLSYNPYDDINTQITSPENYIAKINNELIIGTEKIPTIQKATKGNKRTKYKPSQKAIRTYTVQSFPEIWAQWECANLIGNNKNDFLRMSCPFITNFSFITSDDSKNMSRANAKLLKAAQHNKRGSILTRFDADIGARETDWKFVKEKLKTGKKLVETYYSVTILADKNSIDEQEQRIKSIYKSSGWQIQEESFSKLPAFLINLPFTLNDRADGQKNLHNKNKITANLPFLSKSDEGVAGEMRRLGKFKNMVTWTCANLVPIQGEWKGMNDPCIMLLGRKGQPLYWNPFANREGNYNTAVIGKSGSGKSFLMQEIVSSLLGYGGNVFVIDDGRSFMNLCNLLGGNFVCFDGNVPICINPFSLIHEDDMDKTEYREEVLNFINGLVEQMCSPKGNLTEYQQNIIQQSVSETWSTYKTQATITNIKQYLEKQNDPRVKDLAVQLQAYTKGGIFEDYFEGQCSLQANNEFMVFELAELKNKKNLQSIVMMILMFIISQKMYFGDRTKTVSLVIDEAWDLLSGGKSIGNFIEGFARRARKYGGNIITGTQSVNDYYKNPAAQAAMENSDWMVFLSQKAESISELKERKRVNMNSQMEEDLRSLIMKDKEYSEVMIYGPGGYAIGRFVADSYSTALYSSKAEDFKRIKQLQQQGYSLEEAVEVSAGHVK
jgi:conjugal transfer ATP-binding protein TraC